MNFHITTKKYSVDFLENCVQYENLYIYFDGTVEYTESTNFISLFTGILWSGTLEGVPNGQFYSVKINKNYKIIEVITDFIEDFPELYAIIIYYQKTIQHCNTLKQVRCLIEDGINELKQKVNMMLEN